MDTAEQDNIEALRIWWKKYGQLISAVVLLGALFYGGYTWWNWQQAETKASASEAYSLLIRNIEGQDEEAFIASAEQIIEQYPQLPYADLSSLLLAERYVTNKQWDEGIASLERIVDNSSIPALQDVARLRLARLYLAHRDIAMAHKVLENASTKTFEPLVFELKGDLYRLQGDKALAIETYQQALQSDPIARELRETFLVMKLGDLGVGADDINLPLE
jgi:predicted negative regulator of RcsB-dependent stress response